MNNHTEDARYLYDQICKFRILNEHGVNNGGFLCPFARYPHTGELG